MLPLPDSWGQTGTIAAAVFNSQRIGGPIAKPSDFIPSVEVDNPQRRGADAAAQKALWKAYCLAQRKKKKRKLAMQDPKPGTQ